MIFTTPEFLAICGILIGLLGLLTFVQERRKRQRHEQNKVDDMVETVTEAFEGFRSQFVELPSVTIMCYAQEKPSGGTLADGTQAITETDVTNAILRYLDEQARRKR